MIRATRDRIIILQSPVEKTSAGGIVLDIHQSTPQDRGVVQNVGANVSGIEIGDTVIISHLGTPVGENLMSVASEYCVAIVE